MSIILRKNRRFCINEDYIKPEHRISAVINGLYAHIYEEFSGASKNPKYKTMTYQERMQKLNDCAEVWLKSRGFYQ